MVLTPFLWGILHTILVVAMAPLITGITRLTKARLQGRPGASVFQPYRDLLRLLRKEALVPESASPLFRYAPYLVFVSVWLAATIMPTFTTDNFTSSGTDRLGFVKQIGGVL